MTTSPSELLTAAQSVCAISKDEAMFRASISRLYYASYHRCFAYHAALPSLGSVGNANGLHEQLIAQLSNPAVKLPTADRLKSQAIGKMLRLMCANRVKSDYRCAETVQLSDMRDSQQSATTIFSQT